MLKFAFAAILFLISAVDARAQIPLLSGDPDTCPKAANYAAQYKLRALIGHDPFYMDKMSFTQLGNEHWWLRVRAVPWSEKIADPCIRKEMQRYIAAEIYFVETATADRKNDPALIDEQEQDRGRELMDKAQWPK